MTDNKPTTIEGMAALVEQGIEAILPEGAAKPSDGAQTCGECQGDGEVTRSWRTEPLRCMSCSNPDTQTSNGLVEPPVLVELLRGLYTDRGGLRRRKSYLSPVKVAEKSNWVTADVYTYVRANLEFDLGRNMNLGGMIMNDLRRDNPWKSWADAVNQVLLALHGRTQSAGATRWAQAMGYAR